MDALAPLPLGGGARPLSITREGDARREGSEVSAKSLDGREQR